LPNSPNIFEDKRQAGINGRETLSGRRYLVSPSLLATDELSIRCEFGAERERVSRVYSCLSRIHHMDLLFCNFVLLIQMFSHIFVQTVQRTFPVCLILISADNGGGQLHAKQGSGSGHTAAGAGHALKQVAVVFSGLR